MNLVSLSFLETLQRKLESTQEELMKMQIRYQKEIEKLEKQNRDLKTQLLLKSSNQAQAASKLRKIKVNLLQSILKVTECESFGFLS
jgi:optic atrophy protein 1